MSATIHPFPVQPEPHPTPPAAPCGMCGGSGYEETWLPDYRTGGTICTGSVRCTGCAGSGKEAGEQSPASWESDEPCPACGHLRSLHDDGDCPIGMGKRTAVSA